jgi:hypothetical protein
MYNNLSKPLTPEVKMTEIKMINKLARNCILTGLVILLLTITLIVIGINSFLANQGTSSVEKELNLIIEQRDLGKITAISEGKETKEFLMNLPKGTKATRTSSAQGAQRLTDQQGRPISKVYFVTVLNGTVVNVYMYEDRQSTFYYNLFPKWTVAQVHI